jgi:hypothetical protein
MTDKDYENLFQAYVEFAMTTDDRFKMPGLVKTHYICGCDSVDKRERLVSAFQYEVEHNAEGLRRLSEKVSSWQAYVLVASLSTQVVVNIDAKTTSAVLVETPLRNGLLRWAGKQQILCYASDLEISPHHTAEKSNVVQIVF